MKRPRIHKMNESGMVSIMVTLFLIMIMSLMVIAMSKNANREQRQSLDRQLSDQAFYNAMTGISDWTNYLLSNPAAPASKTACSVQSGEPPKQIDGNNSVSCVLYNKAPGQLDYSVTSDKGVTATLSSATTATAIRFDVMKQDGSNITSSNCGFGGALLPTNVNSGCDIGGIEVGLTPVPSGSTSRSVIKSSSFTGYFLPVSSGSSGSPFSLSDGLNTNQGVKKYMTCSTSKCTITVSGLSITSTSKVLLHIKSLYIDSKVSVVGLDGASNVVPFYGSQIMIDATGKAQDVLRRVQVRVPIDSQYVSTDLSIRTVEDLCQLMDVTKNTETRDSDGFVLSNTIDVAPDISKCPID